jgi:aryl-alcohol dehydrogenase-like predicted oxidoreductase
MLAKLLPARRNRGIVLATKAGMPHPDAGDDPPLSPRALRASVDGSLRRLGVDRVDLFYLHQPDRATPLAETLAVVAELVDAGKIGSLGVSNFAAWHIGAVNAAADAAGAPRPFVAQQLYNLVARRVEEEYFEFATTTGVATMVYNPLGGGLLTGRHQFGERPEHGRFGDSRLAAMYTERYWNAELFAGIEALARIAEQAGIGLAELALRWLLGQDRVSSVLLGGSKVAHLQANLAAAEKGPLAADVTTACDEVGARLRGPMPAYHR